MKQLIEGRIKSIEINPHILTGELYPLIDNNFESQREDREATPELKVYVNPVRIVKKKAQVKKTNDNTTPIVYEEVWFMISDNETIVDVRLEFDYEGMKFKVKKRESEKRYGIITGYQYKLDDITEELTI